MLKGGHLTDCFMSGVSILSDRVGNQLMKRAESETEYRKSYHIFVFEVIPHRHSETVNQVPFQGP